MRSPALTRHGLDPVDALVQKSPEFSILTFWDYRRAAVPVR